MDYLNQTDLPPPVRAVARPFLVDRRGAELLFQVLTQQEEENSVAIASNEPSSGWTNPHRPPALRGHRRPSHLRRHHHRDPAGTDSYRLATTRARAGQQPAAS